MRCDNTDNHGTQRNACRAEVALLLHSFFALLPSVHYILLLVLIKSSFAKRWLRLEGKVIWDSDLGEPFLIAMYVFTLSVETLPSPCQT